MTAKKMNDIEFYNFLGILKKEYGDMKPGDEKRICLIGAVCGYAKDKYALTGTQLEKIFDMGFSKKEDECPYEAATSGHSGN